VRREEIERFRIQIEAVDLIGEQQIDTILSCVADAGERNPGPFQPPAISDTGPGEQETQVVDSWHRESLDYEEDPTGFFVIQIDSEKRQILVEHYSPGFKLLRQLHGDTALRIYSTIIRNGWVSVLGHAAYLGRELYKAELALERGWSYEQNKDLEEE